jgi:hypothetical protein
MKKVILKWEYDADIINVPDIIAENIYEYQIKFDKWIYDQNNKHKYWVTVQTEDSSFTAVKFGSEAFVTWLNDYILNKTDDKVTFELRNIQLSDEHKELQLLYF